MEKLDQLVQELRTIDYMSGEIKNDKVAFMLKNAIAILSELAQAERTGYYSTAYIREKATKILAELNWN